MFKIKHHSRFIRPRIRQPLIVLTVILPLQFFQSTAMAQGSDDPMKWDRYENEVGQDRFSNAYIDSIKQIKGVGDNRGLGEPVNLRFRKEKLVFDGGWGFMRAGWAILVTEPEPTDSTMLNIIGKVLSNSFVSTFYKVRDYVHAHCDASSLYPLFFEQHIQEGRYTDQRWTIFDHRNRQVYYNWKKGDIQSPAEPGIQNYLSILYLLRTMEFAVGDSFYIRCFYHRKDYPILFRIKGWEKVSVPAGNFDCFIVEPRLAGEGRGFSQNDQLTVWLTSDSLKMPVLIRAKINIGSLSARLLHYERD